LGELRDLPLVLGIDRVELLVDALELFVRALELLVRRLELLVGGRELLVARLELLDRRLQVLLRSLELRFDQRQLTARGLIEVDLPLRHLRFHDAVRRRERYENVRRVSGGFFHLSDRDVVDGAVDFDSLEDQRGPLVQRAFEASDEDHPEPLVDDGKQVEALASVAWFDELARATEGMNDLPAIVQEQ